MEVVRPWRYPEVMAIQVGEVNEQGEVVVEMFADFIPVTAEGKARARKLLDDAAARRDPERRAKLRAQLNLPPRD